MPDGAEAEVTPETPQRQPSLRKEVSKGKARAVRGLGVGAQSSRIAEDTPRTLMWLLTQGEGGGRGGGEEAGVPGSMSGRGSTPEMAGFLLVNPGGVHNLYFI